MSPNVRVIRSFFDTYYVQIAGDDCAPKFLTPWIAGTGNDRNNPLRFDTADVANAVAVAYRLRVGPSGFVAFYDLIEGLES